MKAAYPIVITRDEKFLVVDVPDFCIGTQGVDLADAIEMARDAIGLMGIDMEDHNRDLPAPSNLSDIETGDGDIVTLVDVDFTEYRRKNELRTVKKNCTLPSWLCAEAEKANLNFSQLLQSAIKRELRIAD